MKDETGTDAMLHNLVSISGFDSKELVLTPFASNVSWLISFYYRTSGAVLVNLCNNVCTLALLKFTNV